MRFKKKEIKKEIVDGFAGLSAIYNTPTWLSQKKVWYTESKRTSYEQAVQYLQILTYDEISEEYTLTQYKTMRCLLPRNAVHVTGKKGYYFLDLVRNSKQCDPDKCTAIDLDLWMQNNDINDALLYKYTSGQVDTKKVITIAVIAIIAIIVVWTIIPR